MIFSLTFIASFFGVIVLFPMAGILMILGGQIIEDVIKHIPNWILGSVALTGLVMIAYSITTAVLS